MLPGVTVARRLAKQRLARATPTCFRLPTRERQQMQLGPQAVAWIMLNKHSTTHWPGGLCEP